ncbi:MAG TPA: DUF202 domain-containing protein [Gemmatimonadaceae bacterium]|nr:DUF202 domain-containing protein [Gemmatimonadaceae bacterium]
MSDPSPKPASPAPPQSLPDATALAVDRTRLAHDRTMMAWIRTATSMISFGFTIYKFFQEQREVAHLGESHRIFGSREFGMLLVGLAIVCLVLATIQQQRDMKMLREKYGIQYRSLATLLAGLLAIVGVITFLAVAYRV